MRRHKLHFLLRYRNPSPLVVSDERTEHRCAFILCAAIPSLKARTGVRSLALIIRSDDDQTPSRHALRRPVFVGKLPTSRFGCDMQQQWALCSGISASGKDIASTARQAD